MLGGKESHCLRYTNDVAELRINIEPDIRFYSIGLLGAPIIPMRFRISEQNEVALEISLELRSDCDFSFASNPCLTDHNSNLFYPYRVEYFATAWRQDDGSLYSDKQKRLNAIACFYTPENRGIRILTRSNGNDRISRKRIYQLYGYTGAEKWDYFRVNFTYKYKCAQANLKQLDLDLKNLAVVANLPMPDGSQKFQKKRQNKYRFLELVQ